MSMMDTGQEFVPVPVRVQFGYIVQDSITGADGSSLAFLYVMAHSSTLAGKGLKSLVGNSFDEVIAITAFSLWSNASGPVGLSAGQANGAENTSKSGPASLLMVTDCICMPVTSLPEEPGEPEPPPQPAKTPARRK